MAEQIFKVGDKVRVMGGRGKLVWVIKEADPDGSYPYWVCNPEGVCHAFAASELKLIEPNENPDMVIDLLLRAIETEIADLRAKPINWYNSVDVQELRAAFKAAYDELTTLSSLGQ